MLCTCIEKIVLFRVLETINISGIFIYVISFGSVFLFYRIAPLSIFLINTTIKLLLLRAHGRLWVQKSCAHNRPCVRVHIIIFDCADPLRNVREYVRPHPSNLKITKISTRRQNDESQKYTISIPVQLRTYSLTFVRLQTLRER